MKLVRRNLKFIELYGKFNIIVRYCSSKQNTKNILIKDIDGQARYVNILDILANDASNTNSIPIVLLLGTGQTIQTFTQHYRHFSRKSRLIIPELRCQGKTELLTESCTMEQFINDLDKILEELNINTCHLVGFSFGGRVGLAYAANKPNKVGKLSITCVPYCRPGNV